jgi:ATP-binding cassette subfamily B protein
MSIENQEKPSAKIFDAYVFRRVFVFVKPYIKVFYLIVFLTITMGLLSPLRPKLTEITIDRYIAVGDYAGLKYMVALIVGLTFLQFLIQFSHAYLSGFLSQNVIRDIRGKLYEHLLSLKLRFYDKTPIGRLVTRTIGDIETMSQIFTDGFAEIIGDLLQILFLLGFMLYTDWRLTLISLSTLPVLLLATYYFKQGMKYSFNEVKAAVANLNSFVQEHITGMSVVQIFGIEDREHKKFQKINKEHLAAHLKAIYYNSVYFPVAEIISATGFGLLIWFGAKEVLDQEGVTIGVLTAFIMYIGQFYRPIRMIADKFNSLQMGIVSSERILKILDNQDFVADTGTLWPQSLSGKVEFENVWFAYNDENWVLKNISFEVQPGQTLALVGATGAGKSSVINLLTRLYDINKGTIKVDGVDIRDYRLEFLRSHIGLVLQDVFLFSDTIFNNITLLNPDIKAEQVYKAAQTVGALEFIEKLPGGFEYNVMERGATLSVGQRQLVAFMRALVYDPQIIILDEATSSVDHETEEMIQHAIENLMRGRTAIVIAHRLATIQKADKIIVMDKGEIKEEGNHEELLKMNGLYEKLYSIQYSVNLSQ